MNKKKLPKAIMRLQDDMQSDAASLTLEPRAPARSAGSSSSTSRAERLGSISPLPEAAEYRELLPNGRTAAAGNRPFFQPWPEFFIRSIRLFGRISVQFFFMNSRHAARLSELWMIVQPSGTLMKVGQRECCPSSLMST